MKKYKKGGPHRWFRKSFCAGAPDLSMYINTETAKQMEQKAKPNGDRLLLLRNPIPSVSSAVRSISAAFR